MTTKNYRVRVDVIEKNEFGEVVCSAYIESPWADDPIFDKDVVGKLDLELADQRKFDEEWEQGDDSNREPKGLSRT